MNTKFFAIAGVCAMFAACVTVDTTGSSGSQSSISGSQPAMEYYVSAECQVGGCSAQICQGIDEEPAMSDCMYRPAYECYKTGRCEKQADGLCNWTMTPQLSACLMNPPEANPSSVSA